MRRAVLAPGSDELSTILLVHKPAGPTSFQVIAGLRRSFKVKRAGHGGTLDSTASGLLVVGLGRATRLLTYALGHDKEYVAEVLFGRETDTLDLSGDILYDQPASPDPLAVETVLQSFVGETIQEPPVYSALKQGGRTLSSRVRAGETPDLTSKCRQIRIDSINDVQHQAGEQSRVRFTVRCGAGTYIRSLARDIGRKLGIPSVLSALSRTAVGDFRLEEASPPDHPPEDFPRITPAEFLTRTGIPGFIIADDDELAVRHGNPVRLNRNSADICYVTCAGGPLLAIGQLNVDGIFQPRKVFA